MKQEHEYLEYKRLGQKLGIPTFEAFLELEVRMPDGRVIHRHRQRSHSWVRNAYNCLFCEMAEVNANDDTFGAGKVNVKDTGGTLRYTTKPAGIIGNITMLGAGYGYTAGAGLTVNGIVVGSGTNAESFEDYVLQTLIANGTAEGQLSYVASEAYAISYASLVLTNTLVRYMNNNSGGNVSVNEIGLLMMGWAAGSNYYWLMSRVKLGSTVTVPDTGKLTITYTISLTYPS